MHAAFEYICNIYVELMFCDRYNLKYFIVFTIVLYDPQKIHIFDQIQKQKV